MAASSSPGVTTQPANFPAPDRPAVPSRIKIDSRPPNAHDKNLWAKAKELLSGEDQKVIESGDDGYINILDKVLEVAKEKKEEARKKQWTFKHEGKTIVVREVLEKIISWLKKFQEITDFAVSMDISGHAAIPWSVIKFVIEMAGKDGKKYGAVLEGMEFVAREISYYSIFEGTYLYQSTETTEQLSKITDQLSAGLVEVYSKILELLVQVKKYFDQHTLTRFVESLVDDAGLDGKVAGIEKQRPRIERLASQINIEQMRKDQLALKQVLEGWRNVPSKEMTAIVDSIEDAKRQKILEWLSSIRYWQHHDFAKEPRLEGTGVWLLDHSDFARWQKSSNSSLLWLHGLQGTGKTTLVSLVIDYLCDDDTVDRESNPLAYFYCTRDPVQRERADPIQVLRSIVRQLASSKLGGPIRKEILNAYEELADGRTGLHQLTMEESMKLIIELTKTLSSVTIVIDAMDECDCFADLFDKLRSIVKQSTSCPMRIFVSSRDDDSITIQVQQMPINISIPIGDNSEDIKFFVKTEVERQTELKRLLKGNATPQLKERIIKTLTEGAQGMFRWASLQLESLCDTDIVTEIAVDDVLRDLPEELKDIYAKLYRQVIRHSSNKAIAERTLKFIFCCVTHLDTTSFLTAVCPELYSDGSSIDAEALLSICRNLIIQDSQMDTFRFAHLSVREYLETREDYTEAHVHAAAGEICLNRIANVGSGARKPAMARIRDQVNKISSIVRRSTFEREQQEPVDNLFDYVTVCWAYHCELAGDNRTTGTLQKLMQDFLLPRRVSRIFVKWVEDGMAAVEKHGPRLTPQLLIKLRNSFCAPPHPHYVACAFGFTEIIASELTKPPERNREGIPALHVASAAGSYKIVRILLDRGAVVDAKDIYGNTPLFYAVATPGPGRVEVAELLLEKDKTTPITEALVLGALATSFNGKTGTKMLDVLYRRDGKLYMTEAVMERAAMAEDDTLIRWLCNQPEEYRITRKVLVLAAFRGSPSVVKFILEQEPDLKVTELMLIGSAANLLKGAVVTLKLLLSNFEGERIPETVLEAAATNNSTEALDTIFDKDDQLQVTYKTLKLAAKNGNWGKEVIEYLVNRKPDLKASTSVLIDAGKNRTPAQGLAITQLLLARDPTLQITDGVVKAAASAGNKALVQFLLDRNENLQVTEDLLLAAAECSQGYVTVKFLCERNPAIQISDKILLAAARQTHKYAIAYLLGRSPSTPITTALLISAASHGAPQTVSFLLSRPNTSHLIRPQLLIAAIQHPISSREISELIITAYAPKRFVMTPEIAVAAAKNSRVAFAVLLEYHGSMPVTDEVWKMAAAALEPGMMQLLLEGYAKTMPELRMLLDIAATSGSRQVVRLLLTRAGLDAEKGSGKSWFDAAQLMWAAFEGDEEKVVELLVAGVPPNLRDERTGWTPLWLAARMGWTAVVQRLLETGRVDVDAKLVACEEKVMLWTTVVGGETALWTAAQMGNEDIVKLLLEKGADINVRNHNGESVMDVVERNNLEFVAEILRDWEQCHQSPHKQ